MLFMLASQGWECARAATPPDQSFDLPAQDLGEELRTIGRQTGRDIMFPANAVAGKAGKALQGRFSADAAVDYLLEGTGLVAQHDRDVVLIRGRSEASASGAPGGGGQTDIVVTGSRIRGAPVASPVIRLDQATMLNEGHGSLASALRDLPQNFGGGQNPGIGLGTAGSIDDSGASTINLRGLGGDATLTVLNGHRLPYNADGQTIDISNIPLDAVDRVEIVPDGSSALYGSDAVAGVANIILRHDMDGIRATARVGTSESGGAQRQFDLSGGTTWNGGGFLLAYDYEHDLPIEGDDRSYTRTRAPGLYLTPELHHDNVLLTGHQDLTSWLSFSVDALYNVRSDRLDYALDPSGSVLASGGSVRSRDRSYSITPSVSARLPGGWHASASAMQGEDRDHYLSLGYFAGAPASSFDAVYRNRSRVAELTADGPLVDLGSGDIRTAIGGGYRSNSYTEATFDVDARQTDYYAFGELNVPLIAPAEHIPAVHSLALSGAVRYEHYPRIASVVSPKLGAIYAPSEDLDLKASWGRSFKTPTFDQRFVVTHVGIDPASAYGGTGLPADATVVDLVGGNPKVGPERATSWSATASLHPRFLRRASLDITYFHVRYRDRVVQPIAFQAQALSNPAYSDLVHFNPSMQEIADAVAAGDVFNDTGRAFDPNDVVAIVDDRYLNVARQIIHGIDAAGRYAWPFTGSRTLTLTADASYLVSHQQLSELQSPIALAGKVFNPPHLRLHGGLIWSADPLTLSAYANYTGKLKDVRSATPVSIGAMTTLDLTVRYATAKSRSFFGNWDIAFTVQNLLDAKPPLLANTQVYEQPYDASNYSPVGRFVSLRVSKSW